MTSWANKHEIIWVALGNDDYNTLIGIAQTYEAICIIGMDWSKATGCSHYLREYVEKQEVKQPTLPSVIELDGRMYRAEDA